MTPDQLQNTLDWQISVNAKKDAEIERLNGEVRKAYASHKAIELRKLQREVKHLSWIIESMIKERQEWIDLFCKGERQRTVNEVNQIRKKMREFEGDLGNCLVCQNPIQGRGYCSYYCREIADRAEQ